MNDIEGAGGLHKFGVGVRQALSKLLNLKEHVCGRTGSDIRRTISQKVDKWKRLPEVKHLEVLKFHGVVAAKFRKTISLREKLAASPVASRRISRNADLLAPVADSDIGSDSDAASKESDERTKKPTEEPEPPTQAENRVVRVVGGAPSKQPKKTSIPRKKEAIMAEEGHCAPDMVPPDNK